VEAGSEAGVGGSFSLMAGCILGVLREDALIMLPRQFFPGALLLNKKYGTGREEQKILGETTLALVVPKRRFFNLLFI